MATEQLLQVDRGVGRRSGALDRRAGYAVSTRSTTLRADVRSHHVYVDVQDLRYLAERIHDPQLAVAPPSDHAFAVGHRAATADATLSSLHDAPRRDTGRFLTTVLMTDIVDSTHALARLGDCRWRDLLAAHYADCRAQIHHHGGRLLTTTGDGIIAIFDAPTRAIGAARAIQALARESGIAVRAGIHTGECEWLGDGLAGLAVHIAARICALGTADEILTTGTVRELVIGSMLAFEPRGHHELKGVPGHWTVYRATDPA